MGRNGSFNLAPNLLFLFLSLSMQMPDEGEGEGEGGGWLGLYIHSQILIGLKIVYSKEKDWMWKTGTGLSPGVQYFSLNKFYFQTKFIR